jgi:hypothetical protein
MSAERVSGSSYTSAERGYEWTRHGTVAAEVESPDGQVVAIVGLHAEKELRRLDDPLHRRRLGSDEAAERERARWLGTAPASYGWAERICDALNAYEGEAS